MSRRALPSLLALSLALLAGTAAAAERAFVYAEQSPVLTPGTLELEPWTTFSVGRERYYSELDGRLGLERGISPALQLSLFWSFETRTRDVIVDDLTGKLGRVSESELASASLQAKYQLSDPVLDLLGSALLLETTLGPGASELALSVALDRALRRLLVVANVAAAYRLVPVRTADGSELETSFVLEPRLGASWALPAGFRAGVELRAPLGLAGADDGAALFGGPALGWASDGFWATLGALPQLIAFSGKSPGSRLDLSEHERLHVRLLAGLLL
jgi:hypothetical protein